MSGRRRRAGKVGCAAVLAVMAGVAIAGAAQAADKMQFWNLTSNEIDELYLAPAGTDQWGPNQCLNDDDKSVEADERLALKDVAPGQYDVKSRDVHGRNCLVKNVTVKAGGKYAFSIGENELSDCTK
jgi:hypothetical protein